MKRWIVLSLATVAAVLVIGVAWSMYRVTQPRLVSQAVAPDGTEMCVVQQFNWNPELFTTSFVVRKPPGRWGWFYYDHQDDYWGQSRAVLDAANHTAVFYRNGVPAVTYAWDTGTYTLHRWSRVSTKPGWELPAGWTPGQSVYSH